MSRDHQPPTDEMAKALAYRVFYLVMENSRRSKRDRRTMDDLAKEVTHDLDVQVNRQQMYDHMERALSLGLVNLVPPLSQSLHDQIADKFSLNRGVIHVVDARADWNPDCNRVWAGEEVARVGAQRVMALAKTLWESRSGKERRPVAIGVGPGRATAEWARFFSEEFRREPRPPKLVLVAITSGGDPLHPEFVPSNFFSHFPRGAVDFVGLFGPTLITAKELAQLKANPKRMPGFREAFEYAKEDRIDIVVSSMGDRHDKHDLLTNYLEAAEVEIPEDAIGNFQYRYYNRTMPIDEQGSSRRALTLFELPDFREMARRDNQHVILLARTCGQCPRTRAPALVPLLTSPVLKVWKEIIMDVPTAQGLLDKEKEEDAEDANEAC